MELSFLEKKVVVPFSAEVFVPAACTPSNSDSLERELQPQGSPAKNDPRSDSAAHQKIAAENFQGYIAVTKINLNNCNDNSTT